MEVLETPINRIGKQRFEELYENCFPGVAAFVSKMQGSFQDARDIFHDALIIFHEKTSESNFSVTVSEEAYITGIAKHLWIRKYNNDRQKISLTRVEAAITLPEDYFPTIDTRRLSRFLESAGKKCLELLSAFYYEKLSAKDMLKRFGYSTEHSATVQKYKCIEKVRVTLKDKSMTYEDFFE
jgi:DNA-directed RNA polymerase specialized sigma24 family protein